VTSSVLAGLVVVFYSIDLGRAPVYLHPAEVLFALQAHAVATTAHDITGRLLPLYFQMAPIGANVWFQPVIEYFMAPFFWVLPVTEWAVRLPSVVIGAVDVVLLYLIARRLFNSERWAIAAAVLLALTPSHFINSRIAMDYLYPVPFVLTWLLLLLRYLDRPSQRTLFVAASVLGLGVYSYLASVIMMPVYLALTWLTLFANGTRAKRPYVISVAGFVWPLALAALWLLRHPAVVAETMGRYQTGPAIAAYDAAGRLPMSSMLEELRRPLHFFNISGRVSLFWYFFDPAYLFVTGGYANIMNSTRRVGVFLAPLLVFVPAGFLYLARLRRTRIDPLLVLGFASAPLAAVMVVPEPYAIDRELTLLPFAVLIATFGVRAMLTAGNAWWRRAGVALLIVIPLHFAFFCVDYWRDYPLRASYWFEGNHRAALETIIEREPRGSAATVYFRADRLPYIDAYWRFYLLKTGRQDLAARTVFLKDGETAAGAPPGSLLLTRDDDQSANALVESGQLRKLAAFDEPGNPPLYALFQR